MLNDSKIFMKICKVNETKKSLQNQLIEINLFGFTLKILFHRIDCMCFCIYMRVLKCFRINWIKNAIRQRN